MLAILSSLRYVRSCRIFRDKVDMGMIAWHSRVPVKGGCTVGPSAVRRRLPPAACAGLQRPSTAEHAVVWVGSMPLVGFEPLLDALPAAAPLLAVHTCVVLELQPSGSVGMLDRWGMIRGPTPSQSSCTTCQEHAATFVSPQQMHALPTPSHRFGAMGTWRTTLLIWCDHEQTCSWTLVDSDCRI